MRFVFYFLIFQLTSCVSNSQFKTIEPYDVFHNNSSKVWLIDINKSKSTDAYSLKSLKTKSFIVFHSNQNCYQYDFINFGKDKGLKGRFKLDYANKKLHIYFNSKVLSYTIVTLSNESIVLRSLNTSKPEYLKLVSFPEISA